MEFTPHFLDPLKTYNFTRVPTSRVRACVWWHLKPRC
jgi:hypothetical protein